MGGLDTQSPPEYVTVPTTQLKAKCDLKTSVLSCKPLKNPVRYYLGVKIKNRRL